MPVAPTGAQHDVGIDDMFFSTTDSRGVIDRANSVFVRLSRYGRDELLGAPHNIIRHPVMPGGAFLAMWNALEAGEPFAAYVHNLAADGSTYDVFATITPLDEGYLSVRIRPTVQALFDTADAIYQDTRAVEDAALAEGLNRHHAAVRGAGRIGELLGEAGLSAYAQFQEMALPAEVASMETHGFRLPQRSGDTGGPGHMLDKVTRVHGLLEAWMADQDALAELAEALGAAQARVQASIDASSSTGRQIDALEPAQAGQGRAATAALMMPLQLWSSMEQEISAQLSQLLGVLAELQASTSNTRFRIALARLHSAIVAQFLCEVIDSRAGTLPADPAAPESIRMLCRALQQGVQEMDQQAALHRSLTSRVQELTAEACGLMQIPHDLIEAWRATHDMGSLPEGIGQLVPALTEAVAEAGRAMEDLQALADRCAARTGGHDSTELHQLITSLAQDAVYVGVTS